MFENIIKALFRPFARRFFEKIAKDIDTDPETAANFQAISDAKKQWEKTKQTIYKEFGLTGYCATRLM